VSEMYGTPSVNGAAHQENPGDLADPFKSILEGWTLAHWLPGDPPTLFWNGPGWDGSGFTATTSGNVLRIIGDGAPAPFRRGEPYSWDRVFHILRTGKDVANDGSEYAFDAIDSAKFFTTNFSLEWLIERIAVAGQPAVIGGPKKALKTSIAADLAIALAAPTPFLGRFLVQKRCRVLFISGESGEAVLQETARRICRKRGIEPKDLNVFWSFRLPQICNPLDRAALLQGLVRLGVDVVFIDPLYLCLLTGADAREVEAGNLFHVGPILSDICRVCLDAGATPFFLHHARKNLAKPFDPLDLEDLSFAGVQEFARQWLLVSRRAAYVPGTGSHRLWLSAGGSAGHGGCWALDVEEGTLHDDFTGRRWEVTVHTLDELKEEKAEGQADKRTERAQRRIRDDGSRILAELNKRGDTEGRATVKQLRAWTGLDHGHAVRAINALSDEGVIEVLEMEVMGGTNKTVRQTAQAIRRR
jgi:hypothetical protein